jgi:hypothetical protein
LPRRDQLRFRERALPIPHQTKPMEGLDLASCVARLTNHKTSSRTDSQKHILSTAWQRPTWVSERGVRAGEAHALNKTISAHHFSGFDYRRPAQHLAIVGSYRRRARLLRSEEAN